MEINKMTVDKRILYTRNDGVLCIVVPAIDDLDLIIQKDIPADAIDITIVDAADIPEDRYFRNAWTQDDEKLIKIDLDKARSVQLKNIRAIRNEKLAKLDIEIMRALESGDAAKVKEISNRKQILRDLPTTFDLEVYSNPEDLKNAIPTELQ
jgi:hypothetical protein